MFNTVLKTSHKIILNTEFKADTFFPHIMEWSFDAHKLYTNLKAPDFQVWSDASGFWECAALHGATGFKSNG